MKRLLFIIFLLLPISVGAQFTPGQANANIVFNPRLPEPNSQVNVSLNAYTLNTSGASIVWFVDGEEMSAAKNRRSFNLQSKGLGEETQISVRLTLSSGAVVNVNHTLKPSVVDLIIEADTLVPGFYKGRSLPSVGSTIKAIALVQAGPDLDYEDLTYLWKLDNKIQYGGPLKGENTATFQAGLGRRQIISVEITDGSGQAVARKSMAIPLAEPEVHFYIDNPLRGLSLNAIKDFYTLTSNEVTVRAEPYYMNRNYINGDYLIEWEIDGRQTEGADLDPQNLTLRKLNDARGNTSVSFHVRNLKQLVQGAKDSFRIQY